MTRFVAFVFRDERYPRYWGRTAEEALSRVPKGHRGRLEVKEVTGPLNCPVHGTRLVFCEGPLDDGWISCPDCSRIEMR